MAQGLQAPGHDWQSVAFVEVDGLATVNEQHGEEVGDQVVARILRLLTDALPPSAVIHRHGDEFQVLCRFEPDRLERRLALVVDTLAQADDLPTMISCLVLPWPWEESGPARALRRGAHPLGLSGLSRDPLTGLLGRPGLQALLAEHPRRWRALAFLDLDGFKLVNDQFGHTFGDGVLQAFARLLLSMLPGDCVVARIGGDEFAVLSERSPGELAARLEAVEDRFAAFADLGLTFSAGIKRIGPEGISSQDFADADAAMYLAKRDGRDRVIVHGPDVEDFAADRRDLLDRLARMHETIRKLRTESLTDPLTGLGNRRALDRREEVAASTRTLRGCWGVLFVDIDRFGAFNKRHGDPAGDVVLVSVARTLSAGVRSSDLVQRYQPLQPEVFRKGGEEFVAILAVDGIEEALAVAERVRASVEALAIEHGEAGHDVVTVSVGVAVTDETTSVERAREIAAARAFWLKNHDRRNEVLAHDPPTDA